MVPSKDCLRGLGGRSGGDVEGGVTWGDVLADLNALTGCCGRESDCAKDMDLDCSNFFLNEDCKAEGEVTNYFNLSIYPKVFNRGYSQRIWNISGKPLDQNLKIHDLLDSWNCSFIIAL